MLHIQIEGGIPPPQLTKNPKRGQASAALVHAPRIKQTLVITPEITFCLDSLSFLCRMMCVWSAVGWRQSSSFALYIPGPCRAAAGASRPHAYSLTAVKRELAATYAKRPCISLWWASEQTPTPLLWVLWLFPQFHMKKTLDVRVHGESYQKRKQVQNLYLDQLLRCATGTNNVVNS